MNTCGKKDKPKFEQSDDKNLQYSPMTLKEWSDLFREVSLYSPCERLSCRKFGYHLLYVSGRCTWMSLPWWRKSCRCSTGISFSPMSTASAGSLSAAPPNSPSCRLTTPPSPQSSHARRRCATLKRRRWISYSILILLHVKHSGAQSQDLCTVVKYVIVYEVYKGIIFHRILGCSEVISISFWPNIFLQNGINKTCVVWLAFLDSRKLASLPCIALKLQCLISCCRHGHYFGRGAVENCAASLACLSGDSIMKTEPTHVRMLITFQIECSRCQVTLIYLLAYVITFLRSLRLRHWSTCWAATWGRCCSGAGSLGTNSWPPASHSSSGCLSA